MIIYDFDQNSNDIKLHSIAQKSRWLSENSSNKFIMKAKVKKLTSIEDLNHFFKMEFDPNDEDGLSWYISTLKMLSRELSSNVLSQMYDLKTHKFPILEIFLHYYNHQDNMIRITAKFSILTILKKCQGKVADNIAKFIFPQHMNCIIRVIKNIVRSIKMMTINEKNRDLRAAYGRYEEELEYMNDILSLDSADITYTLRTTFFKDFIIPLLKIITKDENFYKCTKITEIVFILLGKTLITVKNQIFKTDICDFFIPAPFDNEKPLKNKEVGNIRDKIMSGLICILDFNSHHSCLLYVLWLLNIITKFYTLNNQRRKTLYLFKAYCKSLINVFEKSMECSLKLANVELNLSVFILEQLVREKPWADDYYREEMKSFRRLIIKLYLQTCQKIKIENFLDIFFLIDTENKEFMNEKCKLNNGSFNILDVIDESRSNENLLPKGHHQILMSVKQMLRLRFLCLSIKNKREKILPFVPSKAKVGQILSLGNSLPCEKLIYKQTYVTEHFLKLTTAQILILQKGENNRNGIVIFSAYYKDLKCLQFKNNALTFYETMKHNDQRKPLYIHLKFRTVFCADLIVKTLQKFRQKQYDILQQKLDDLLETKCND